VGGCYIAAAFRKEKRTKLVGAAGIEPATICSQSRYATAALRPGGRNYPTRADRLDKESVLDKVRIVSKITSKLQVTIPKAIADRHRLRPGDEIDFVSAGESIRLELPRAPKPLSIDERLRLFDAATRRLRRRKWEGKPPADRGWTRAELYDDRGRPR
jgi:AbrB family looped-hinge helix DNA binding protein